MGNHSVDESPFDLRKKIDLADDVLAGITRISIPILRALRTGGVTNISDIEMRQLRVLYNVLSTSTVNTDDRDAIGGDSMHCSWCGRLLPFCECPASLARSIDKERAEAIRERNELREQLMVARREVEALRQALTDIASGELGINVSIRCARAALAATPEAK